VKNKKIGLMVFPLRSPEWQYFVDQILSFITTEDTETIVMTGNYFPKSLPKNATVFNINVPQVLSNHESVFSKLLRFSRTQYYMSSLVIKKRNYFDAIVLHLGAPYLTLPVLLSYLMRKKIVVVIVGSDSQSLKLMYPGISGTIYCRIVRCLEVMTYSMAKNIIVTSGSMISPFGLQRYKHKVISSVGNSPFGGTNAFIDTDKFNITVDWKEREDIIGFIGRLSTEKGITELVEAIPQIVKVKNNARFLIVGRGPLLGDLKRKLNAAGCLDKVTFMGAVPHENIPQILNKMKFLIVPSYTEVVAATALEAMASGTVCLATAVGATQDIIAEGQTGFILSNNKPETITRKIVEVWGNPELVKIQLNARKFIEDNFSQQQVLNRWNIIMNKVMK